MTSAEADERILCHNGNGKLQTAGEDKEERAQERRHDQEGKNVRRILSYGGCFQFNEI